MADHQRPRPRRGPHVFPRTRAALRVQKNARKNAGVSFFGRSEAPALHFPTRSVAAAVQADGRAGVTGSRALVQNLTRCRVPRTNVA